MSQSNNPQAAALAKISILFKYLNHHEQNHFVVAIHTRLSSLQNHVETGHFSLATQQIALLKEFLGETSEIFFVAILNDIQDLISEQNQPVSKQLLPENDFNGGDYTIDPKCTPPAGFKQVCGKCGYDRFMQGVIYLKCPRCEMAVVHYCRYEVTHHA